MLFFRFSEEEKKDRSPLSWMPFGYGPRNCIGMRLALLEMKIVACHVLYNFKMEPCSTTQVRISLISLLQKIFKIKIVVMSSSSSI